MAVPPFAATNGSRGSLFASVNSLALILGGSSDQIRNQIWIIDPGSISDAKDRKSIVLDPLPKCAFRNLKTLVFSTTYALTNRENIRHYFSPPYLTRIKIHYIIIQSGFLSHMYYTEVLPEMQVKFAKNHSNTIRKGMVQWKKVIASLTLWRNV